MRDDTAAADTSPAPAEGEARDSLLDRAEQIADLPLQERPTALDGLNRAVVDELQALEEG